MHRHRLAILCTLMLAALSGSSCSLPERTLPGVTLFMSSPLDGSVLALGPVHLLAAADISSTSPFSGYDLGDFIFYANGVTIATVPSGGGSRDAVGATWTPTAPGEYLLQASAKIIDGPTATSATIRVCVVETPAGGELYPGIWGYTGHCDTSGLHSEFTEPGPISMHVIAAVGNIYFNPTEATSCTLVRIDYYGFVTDPPDEVYDVMVEYSVADASGAGLNVGRLHLARAGGVFPEKEYFSLTEDLDDFFRDAGVTGESEIEWTALAFGYDWALLLTDGPHTIPAHPCTLTSATPPAETPIASRVPVSLRCAPFESMPIELVTLDWTPGTPLNFYFKMPGGVPGLENQAASGDEPWLYSVDWGGMSTDQCKAIAGYPERLYCGIVLPDSYANTLHPLELHLNGCDQPIFRDLRADVPGFAGLPGGGGPKPPTGCQAPPQGCGANSIWYAEPFCLCSPY